MYLWSVWKSFQTTSYRVVTKEKSIYEVLKVLEKHDYGTPEKIEFICKVKA